MSWFKVDDGFHSSRKVLSIPKRARFAAVGLWSIAGSWSADQLTDGVVPDYMLEVWGAPPAAPESLVQAGLWERESTGYVFRNWHEYQPSKQDVDAERAASRERMRDLRARRKQRKPLEQTEQGDVFGRTDTNGSENVRNPDPTRPDPVPTRPIYREEADASSSAPRKREATPKRGTRIPEDFNINPAMRLWAAQKAQNANLELETEKFINYWASKTGKDATKLDWAATWRNWILNSRSNQQGQPRMDQGSRALAKGAQMLAAWDAQQEQETILEVEA